MKKVLTVLCFALCASVAFAQTNRSMGPVSKNVHTNAQAVQVGTVNDAASYTGSIFTKDDPVAIISQDFHAEPRTGVLSATDCVNGTEVGLADAHTQSFYGSMWHRLTDTTAEYLTGIVNNYPVFAGYFFEGANGEDFPFRSNSVADGYMLMSMMDQIQAWGGTGTVGGFNAWFAVTPDEGWATTGHAGVYVRLYEYYRCFNSDKCWIDYSTDGNTWNAIEFNVARVDVNVNSSIRGNVRVNLPLTCGNQSSVHIRVRWSCANNGNTGGAYGYFWAVDDAELWEIPSSDIAMNTNKYFEGFYHIMPQGLQVPMTWSASYTNTGTGALTGINGHVYHQNAWNGTREELASQTASNINYLVTDTISIDPYNWVENYGFTIDAHATPALSSLTYLPTDREGLHFVNSSLATAEIPDAFASDTVGYRVYGMNEDNPMAVQFDSAYCAIWGRDNGALIRNSALIAYMSGEHTFTQTPGDGNNWTNAGYGQYVTYATGPEVPAGWRIKGVQIISATTTGNNLTPSTAFFTQPGCVLFGDLTRDSAVYDGDEIASKYFLPVETGAAPHEVTQSELLPGQRLDNLTYLTYENGYAAINLEFLAQPELMPNTNYAIGYRLWQDGYFAPANGLNVGYYTVPNADGEYEVKYFDDEADLLGADNENYDLMKSYSRSFGRPNTYSHFIYDYTYANTYSEVNPRCFLNLPGSMPMIRMILGPYEEKPTSQVTFECGDNGSIWNSSQEEEYSDRTVALLSTTIQTFVCSPDEGYAVDQIFISDTVAFTNDTLHEMYYYEGDISESFVVDGDMTIRVTFMPAKDGNTPFGIDAISKNVTMNLMPNPATSSTQLTIAGVEGMVELSLIDMSGRVIRSSKVNAEQAQNIDLSKLAKGAYFVRITNSDFTKVEKLIVR